ncbi:MAG: PAS domain S-box protein [Gemmatimonadota bacterium]
MDIRTKLVFAYVVVALGCMAALGAATYVEARGRLRVSTLQQLVSLADSKQEALELIIEGWGERVALIASRTQLRLSLRSHNEDARADAAPRIRAILEDAVRSSTSVTLAAVYDVSGDLLAWAAEEPHRAADDLPASLAAEADGVSYRDATPVPGSGPVVAFVAALALDGEILGTLYAQLAGNELVELTSRYGGLGETGETLVVMRTDADEATVLHPTRHPNGAPVRLAAGPGDDNPISAALSPSEGTRWVDATDYRGAQVWAATRHVAETGWGVVVKVDHAEAQAPVVEFREKLARLGLSLSAFAILLGTVTGLRLAKPIHDLAEVVTQVRHGTLSARADEEREDEVGLLARAFNEMAGELEQRMTSLQEYKKFFDVSLDLLCVAGTDGYFKRTNPSFERVLGWSEEDLLRRPFLEIIHPEDIEATEKELDKLSQGIPTVSFVNRFRCADGTYKRLVWTSYPDPETGLLYAIAHDVRERSEERS